MAVPQTKKYKIGIDFTFRGHCYHTIDAYSEEDAVRMVDGMKEDIAYEAVRRDGAGNIDCEIDDVILPKAG